MKGKEGKSKWASRRERPANPDVEPAHLGLAFLGSFINFCFVILGWVASYFAICYPTLINAPSYNEAVFYRDQAEEAYGLTIGDNASTEEYKKAIEDFYFAYFPERIMEQYVTPTDPDGTLMAFYNVRVLQLPENPSVPSNYQNDLFIYVLDESGQPDVDVMGVMRDDLNDRGLDEVNALYHDAYVQLPVMLRALDPEYQESYAFANEVRMYALGASFAFSYAIFVGVLPFFLKNRANLGQRILKLGICSLDGYKASAFSLLAKAIVGLPLPFFGAFFFSAYSVTLLIAFPYFLNLLFPIFFQKKAPFLETIARVQIIVNAHSTIYADSFDQEAEHSTTLPEYEDRDYVIRLAQTEALDIPLSEEEENERRKKEKEDRIEFKK